MEPPKLVHSSSVLHLKQWPDVASHLPVMSLMPEISQSASVLHIRHMWVVVLYPPLKMEGQSASLLHIMHVLLAVSHPPWSRV